MQDKSFYNIGYSYTKKVPILSDEHFLFLLISVYFATRSNHFTIESITIMDAAVAPTNTNQHAQIGTLV